MRLAHVLGRAMGVGFARTLAEVDEQVAKQVPPTKSQAALQALGEHAETWAREAANAPRAKGSEQAKHLTLAVEYVKARAEEADDAV
jgi:hypothetical protein